MLFCNECGYENLEMAKFCAKCGAAIPENQEEQVSLKEAQDSIEKTSEIEKPSQEVDLKTDEEKPEKEVTSSKLDSGKALNESKTKKSPNWGLIIGCGCAAIIVIFILLIAFFFVIGNYYSKKDKAKPIPSVTKTISAGGSDDRKEQSLDKYVVGIMCKSLNTDKSPDEKTDVFSPMDKLYCSVEVRSVNTSDIVSAKWYKGNEFIKDTFYKVASGDITYIGFSLSLKNGWPAGDDYRIEVYINDFLVDTVSFAIEENTKDARRMIDKKWEAFLSEAVLCKSMDKNYWPINPTAEFGINDRFNCSVNLNNVPPDSYANARWFFGNQFVDQKGIRLQKGGSGHVGFFCTPKKEWPQGDYSLEIFINGHLVRIEKFKVK